MELTVKVAKYSKTVEFLRAPISEKLSRGYLTQIIINGELFCQLDCEMRLAREKHAQADSENTLRKEGGMLFICSTTLKSVSMVLPERLAKGR